MNKDTANLMCRLQHNTLQMPTRRLTLLRASFIRRKARHTTDGISMQGVRKTPSAFSALQLLFKLYTVKPKLNRKRNTGSGASGMNSKHDSVLLRSFPPECAAEGATAVVFVLLFFRELHKNLHRNTRVQYSARSYPRNV